MIKTGDISIVLVTYNRLHLLEKCIDVVLSRLSDRTCEVIIWNNASTDGTTEYLDQLKMPQVRVVQHGANIGTNAYARAFKMTKGSLLIELDDDIIDAPPEWDRLMAESFERVPGAGFIAAHCINDGISRASEILYKRDVHLYKRIEAGGVNLLVGPTGGWCTITSRKIYDEIGGFVEDPKFTFWHEDGAYARKVQAAGYMCALLEDVNVLHASGPAYSNDSNVAEAKKRYYSWRDQKRKRRHRIKMMLNRFAFVRMLNKNNRFYTIVSEHGEL